MTKKELLKQSIDVKQLKGTIKVLAVWAVVIFSISFVVLVAVSLRDLKNFVRTILFSLIGWGYNTGIVCAGNRHYRANKYSNQVKRQMFLF